MVAGSCKGVGLLVGELKQGWSEVKAVQEAECTW